MKECFILDPKLIYIVLLSLSLLFFMRGNVSLSAIRCCINVQRIFQIQHCKSIKYWCLTKDGAIHVERPQNHIHLVLCNILLYYCVKCYLYERCLCYYKLKQVGVVLMTPSSVNCTFQPSYSNTCKYNFPLPFKACRTKLN